MQIDTYLTVKKYRFAGAVRRYTPILLFGGRLWETNEAGEGLDPGAVVEELAETNREDEIAENGVLEAGK